MTLANGVHRMTSCEWNMTKQKARFAPARCVVIACLFAFTPTGCNLPHHSRSDARLAGATDAPRLDYSDWALTLSRCVRGDEIDAKTLKQRPESLRAFLDQVARVGPRTTPDQFPDDHAWAAFYINAHNAIVLQAIVGEKRSATPSTVWPPSAAPISREVDGRHESLAELQAKVRDLLKDDWRIRFVLFDARRDGPPLWPRPILPDTLEAQLNQITRAALTRPPIVRIDHGTQRLLLWRGLFDIRERLIADYERRYHTTDATVLSVLLDLADADRRAILNTAIGYAVDVLPADDRPAIAPTDQPKLR